MEEQKNQTPQRQTVDINININVESNSRQSSPKRTDFIDSSEPYEKIKTDLTVQQLAYLFKLLLDLGIFKQRKRTDVMKFIADNFQTRKVEDISVNSLRSKFYATDDTTREVVKDVLIRMVKEVGKG
jgi:hypothetical protein